MGAKFIVRDEYVSQQLEAETMEEAVEQGKEWLSDGDWDRSTTLFLEAWVIEQDDHGGEIDREYIKAVLPAEEPDCVDGSHDWQSPWEILGGLRENPGVWSNGGGVRITEVCMRCGCGKHTDTWAQNPNNGQQGYRTVEYHPREFVEHLEEMNETVDE